MVLRNALPGHGAKEGFLWVLGTWAGIGFGVLAGGWERGLLLDTGLPGLARIIAERMVAGWLLGIVTGTILMILFRKAYIKRDPLSTHSDIS